MVAFIRTNLVKTFALSPADTVTALSETAVRFNDNRSLTVARHGPAPVSFRTGWRLPHLPCQGVIAAWSLTHTAGSGRVVLTQSSTLSRRGFTPWAPSVVGDLHTTYEISADRPFVTLTVRLVPAPGVSLRDVVFGTALNQLDGVPDIAYRTIAVRHLDADRIIQEFGRGDSVAHDGRADYAAVIQGASCPGFCYAIHCLLPDGAGLEGITARQGKRNRLHRVRHLYRVGQVGAGGASISERRMVTGGGYYDDFGPYAVMMRESGGGNAGAGTADPSMTYDIGAELNAVAVHILFARRGRYAVPPDPARLDRLTAWYDRHVERFFEFIQPGTPDELGRVFTRGIAFVVLSLDCMIRATGRPRYRTLLATGVRLILSTQSPPTVERDPHVTFRDIWARNLPFLDNHASCILALARAAWHGDADSAIGRVIHQAVRGIRFHTGTIDVGNGDMVAYDGLAVTFPTKRHLHVDGGYWNYKLGITLRALHAIMAATEAGVLPMTEDQRLQTQLRIDMAGHQLAGSFRVQGEQLEMLTCRRAGETNSETQPWVGLGLVPLLDRQIAALPPVPWDGA